DSAIGNPSRKTRRDIPADFMSPDAKVTCSPANTRMVNENLRRRAPLRLHGVNFFRERPDAVPNVAGLAGDFPRRIAERAGRIRRLVRNRPDLADRAGDVGYAGRGGVDVAGDFV